MRAEARFRPCSSPKAMSTGKCPLGLRLNSGAGRRSQEKMLSVVLAQHCYTLRPAGFLADSHPGMRCPISRHVAYAYSTDRLHRAVPPHKAHTLPSGGLWLHEIKHDGFRVIARKIGAQVRLYSRPGNDLTDRFRLIVETLANLRTRSCIIDGEAVACDDNGLAVFDRIRYRRHDGKVFLYAFDLIELDGDDLRREPLDVRKATLRSLLVKTGPGLRWNEHIEGDGASIFRHACKLGLEGVVSKRKDSPYRSGRSPDWLKMKNPAAPAVKREAEGWGPTLMLAR